MGREMCEGIFERFVNLKSKTASLVVRRERPLKKGVTIMRYCDRYAAILSKQRDVVNDHL